MHRTALATLVLALAACGVEEPDVTPEPDAGTQVDAGTDAGIDAGADAGMDAGTDAGVDPEPMTYGPYTLTLANESDETITIGYVVARDRTTDWFAVAQDLVLAPGAEVRMESALPAGVCQINGDWWDTTLWMKLTPVKFSGDDWPTTPPLAMAGAGWQAAPTYAYTVPCARTTFRVALSRNASGAPHVAFEAD